MATTDRPGILTSLRIKRVALVDSGANFDKKTGDGAHIMLWKRDTSKGPGVGDVHVDSTDWESDYEKANLDAASRNALPDSAFAAVWTDAQGKKHRKLPIHDAGHLAAARGRIAQADIPADVKAAAQRKIDAKTKTKEKAMGAQTLWKSLIDLIKEPDAEKRLTKATALEKAGNPFTDDDDADDKVHKAGDAMCKCDDCMAKRQTAKSAEVVALEKRQEAIEKDNAALRKQNEDLAKSLTTQIEKGEKDDIRVILKSFKHVSVNLEKDADVDVFHAMRKSNPAAYERTIAMMKANDAQLEQSALFARNIGSSIVGEGSAWAQLVAKAEQVVTKSTNPITKEAALEQVMLDPANMGLVKQYRAEEASRQ